MKIIVLHLQAVFFYAVSGQMVMIADFTFKLFGIASLVLGMILTIKNLRKK